MSRLGLGSVDSGEEVAIQAKEIGRPHLYEPRPLEPFGREGIGQDEVGLGQCVLVAVPEQIGVMSQRHDGHGCRPHPCRHRGITGPQQDRFR